MSSPRPSRYLLARLGAAVLLVSGIVTIGAPFWSSAASGAALLQTADATQMCDPIGGGSPYSTAVWHIHLQNNNASTGSLFGVFFDGNADPHYIPANGMLNLTEPGRDGLGSHLTINADGTIILDKLDTVVCNTPITSAVFACSETGPVINYSLNNPSPSTYNFVIHESSGVQFMQQLTHNSMSAIEHVNDGQPYDGYITVNGISAPLSEAKGTAHCAAVDTTTTSTSTSTSTTTSTSTSTSTSTTTSVPVVVDTEPPTTTTTVAVAGTTEATTVAPTPTTVHTAGAAAVDPTTSTTTAPGTLPFTGSTSAPLGLAGFGLCAAGGALLYTVRRRTARV